MAAPFHIRTLLGIMLSVPLVLFGLVGPTGAAKAGDIVRAQEWVARDGNAGYDSSAGMVLSPDGGTVYVAATAGERFAVAAHDGETGASTWTFLSGSLARSHFAHDVAVSPDGTRLFVTGDIQEGFDRRRTLTVALDAATGTLLWAAGFSAGADDDALPQDVAVSPDGSRVYVAGSRTGAAGIDDHWDYFLLAYEAAGGDLAWDARYNGAANGGDTPVEMAIDPGGRRVYVTGTSEGSTTGRDFATVAFSAAGGGTRWVARHDAGGEDYVSAIALSPTGAALYVTGTGRVFESTDHLRTVVYEARSGGERGFLSFDAGSFDSAADVAVSVDGSRLYVTGSGELDFATVAYALPGGRLWVARTDSGKGTDAAVALAVSPDGTSLYVTGLVGNGRTCFGGEVESNDYGTVAYNAATGGTLWLARYAGLSPSSADSPATAAVQPDGSSVFVSGTSDACGAPDVATLSYQA